MSVACDWASRRAGEKLILEMFYTTVNGNPHIASMIQELRMLSQYRAEEDTRRHIDLLRLCKNVVRVEIAGYYAPLSEELRNALTALDLVELDLSRMGEGSQGGSLTASDLCTSSELIACMLKWPRLRRIYTDSIFEPQDHPIILPSPSTVIGCCPALREITFWHDYIHAKNLTILCEMVPNVEKLNVRPHSCTTEALPPSLQKWSPHLTYLSLGMYGTPAIALLCPSFKLLHFLNASATNIPPEVLLDLPRLETLEYIATAEHLERLADVLQENRSLATLRKLNIYPNNELWKKYIDEERCIVALKAIRMVCKDRKIVISDFLSQLVSDEDYSDEG